MHPTQRVAGQVGSSIRTISAALLLLLMLLGMGGCTIGSVGMVAGQVIYGDNAIVVDAYPMGIHLRTAEGDSGMSLGVAHRRYIYAAGERSMSTIPEGRFFGRIPHPPTEHVFTHASIWGIDISSTSTDAGIVLGYQDLAFMAFDALSSVTMTLRYDKDRPAATRLEYCREGRPC